MRDQVCLPYEYLTEMEELTDAEFGQLCRALLRYSKDGEKIPKDGNLRFFAARVMSREDRYQESYQSSSERRKAAGKRGAAKRWRDGKVTNDIANDGKATDDIANDDKNSQAETKTKTKTDAKTDNDYSRVIAAYTEKISGMPSMTCLRELKDFCGKLGAELCIMAMDQAIDMNVRKWVYVRKILDSWLSAGYKSPVDVENAEARRRGKSQENGDKNAWMDEVMKWAE